MALSKGPIPILQWEVTLKRLLIFVVRYITLPHLTWLVLTLSGRAYLSLPSSEGLLIPILKKMKV